MDGLGYGQAKGSMEAVEMKAEQGFRIELKSAGQSEPL